MSIQMVQLAPAMGAALAPSPAAESQAATDAEDNAG